MKKVVCHFCSVDSLANVEVFEKIIWIWEQQKKTCTETLKWRVPKRWRRKLVWFIYWLTCKLHLLMENKRNSISFVFSVCSVQVKLLVDCTNPLESRRNSQKRMFMKYFGLGSSFNGSFLYLHDASKWTNFVWTPIFFYHLFCFHETDFFLSLSIFFSFSRLT